MGVLLYWVLLPCAVVCWIAFVRWAFSRAECAR